VTYHAVNLRSPGPPDAVAVGDVNHDNRPDVVAVAGNRVVVFANRGHGRFAPAAGRSTVGLPTSPIPGQSARALSLAVGDFNGDRRADIAVAFNSGVTAGTPGGVAVLYGDGRGRFSHERILAAGELPEQVVATDLNGDGRLDLLVADAGSAFPPLNLDSGVTALLNDGRGAFLPAVSTNVRDISSPIGLGDFDGDSRNEVVAVDQGPSIRGYNFVPVLRLNSDGTFAVSVAGDVAGPPSALTVGDFNRDGKSDIAVVLGQTEIATLLGHGDGTFDQPVITAPQGLEIGAIASGDFTGDGTPDLVGTDPATGGVGVLPGHGDGTFGPPQGLPYNQQGPVSLLAGDLNQDGSPDAVIGNAGGSITLDLSAVGRTGGRPRRGHPRARTLPEARRDWGP
jgi:hypothetical protein